MKISEAIKLIEAKTGKKVFLENKNLLLEGVFDKMPSNFKKFVTSRQAGENSKLVKITSGFTQKNKLYQLLKEERDNYIAFLGKVNGDWAFMIAINTNSKKMYRFYVANDLIEMLTTKYGTDNNKSVLDKYNNSGRKDSTPTVYQSDGQVSVKNYKYFAGRKHINSGYYSEYELSMDDLWNLIPTGKDVDLYGLSVDKNRIDKRKERQGNKSTENTPEGISSETIKKYIKNKYFNTKVIDDLKNAFLKAGEGILNVEEPQELIKRINDLKNFAETLNKDISVLSSLSGDIDYYVGKDKTRKVKDILQNKRVLNLIKTGKAY